MPTLILSRPEVDGLLKMPEVIPAVEDAFLQWANGRAAMPPKSYLVVDKGDFRAMPAAIPDAVGMKWVNVHTGNPALGLPTVMAVMVYNNPDTGYPLAIMDATGITAYRTGAASAIASKYLARPEARVLGIIGAGRQAHTQLMAHIALFSFDEIRVYDISPEAVSALAKSFPALPVRLSSLKETAAADIICTLTPSAQPYLKREWVQPGAHINAVGADAAGKEELEASLLDGALVVVDDIKQASSAGEINVPIKKGLFHCQQVHASLGEIIAGQKMGRADKEQITIFDSTGVAIEDIAVARLVYEKAVKQGGHTSLELV